MKLLSTEQKLFLLHRKKLIEKLRRKVKRKKLRRKKSKRFSDYKRSSQNSITVPEIINLEIKSHRRQLLILLKELRHLCISETEKSIILDFRHTTHIESSGMLLLYAEVCRISRILPKCRLLVRLPRHTSIQKMKVAQVLSRIGFLKIVKYHKTFEPRFHDVIHWQAVTGSEVDGNIFDAILQKVQSKTSEYISNELWIGISEAMTNCLHHAYMLSRDDGLPDLSTPDWWAFYQFKDGKITVVFCDLGVGIPRSLPRKNPNWFGQLRMALGASVKVPEGKVIQYAIEEGNSRTDNPNRGLGLKQLLQAVQASPQGQLTIYSNKGSYVYKRGQGRARSDYDDSIYGTLINWTIPVGSLVEGAKWSSKNGISP